MLNEPTISLRGEGLFGQYRRLCDQIHPGMSRAHVERLIPQAKGGVQGPNVTLYHVARGVRLEVPFDGSGGAWGLDENKVLAPAKLFLEV